MKSYLSLAGIAVLALLTGCATGPIARRTPYDVVAYKPKNQSDVRIKVSLSNRAVYVLEGNTPLLVTACAIGKPDHPTPTGSYRISGKIPDKRSGEYGFSVSAEGIHPSKASEASGHYVGYPMPWWSEFSPGYGFHEGAVWPTPRSHGCIRLHHNVAPKFYVLAKVGTPVNIAQSQPEDQTIGKNLKRPQDYADKDPDASILISSRAFTQPTGPLLVDRPQ